MLRFEAERAQSARHFTGGVFTLTGAGIVTSGVVSLATFDSNDAQVNGLRAHAYVMMSIGGVGETSATTARMSGWPMCVVAWTIATRSPFSRGRAAPAARFRGAARTLLRVGFVISSRVGALRARESSVSGPEFTTP